MAPGVSGMSGLFVAPPVGQGLDYDIDSVSVPITEGKIAKGINRKRNSVQQILVQVSYIYFLSCTCMRYEVIVRYRFWSKCMGKIIHL